MSCTQDSIVVTVSTFFTESHFFPEAENRILFLQYSSTSAFDRPEGVGQETDYKKKKSIIYRQHKNIN